jgi:hypothetical protein
MIAMPRIALALFVLLAAGQPAAAVEQILFFLSDVQVERNGDLAVSETIRVRAEGNQIRHGIFRDFPTTYTRPDGSRVIVGFEVTGATRDGMSETWATESLSNGVRVRIGRADTTVAAGTHEYVIRYRATRQIGYFADYDELYWNATGNGWIFPIDIAEARISLPERAPFRQSAFYTGPQGASGTDAAVVDQQPGRIVFRTTRSLPPSNGLTVAAAWPKGVITPPTQAQQTAWWLQDNSPSVVAALGLVVVVAFYGFAWSTVGRDPPRGTIIPLFGPPQGMSAAAVRYVDRMGFDDRCFTAAIIDLGVNGHLRLLGETKQLTIEHLQGGRPIGGPEGALAGNLFAKQNSLPVEQANYQIFTAAKNALRGGLAVAYGGKLFAKNRLWSVLGFILSAVVIIALVSLIQHTYDPDRAAAALGSTVIPGLLIAGGAIMIRSGWQRRTRGSAWGTLLLAFGLLVALVGGFVGLAALASFGRGPLDLLPAAAAYVIIPLAVLGFHWLEAPTVTGRAIMDRIEGFRQYLGVAEEDRLNALNPPDKTPQLFERFLPYAIALDVENEWAARFAAVLAAAGTNAAVASWYQTDHGNNDPVSLVQTLGGAFANSVAAASAPPGSSDGGGGGGSSGDGGGGGGGGGW